MPVQTRSRTGAAVIATAAFAIALLTGAAATAGLTRGFDAWGLFVLRDPADLSTPLGPAWLSATARDLG